MMRCRCKPLLFAALLFAVVCNGVSAAAVHRAQGVDAITAKLIGQQPVSSHVRPEGAEAPNQHFAPESWQPLYRELSARRTYEDKISQPALEGGRQQYFPQPRAASLEVAASTLAAPPPSSTTAAPTTTSASVTTIKNNATVSGDSKKRSPEVQDSIALVASQLLNERPAIVDMRKPAAAAPIVQKQQQSEPDKKWEKVVVTNAVPLKVSAQTDRPVTKVPPISEISTKLPATTTAKLAAMPTRFPPRKPAFANAASATEKMVEITTRKPTLATIAAKKPIMEILSTMRPSVISTTKATKNTTVMLTDKKPVAVKNEVATTPRAATTMAVIRRSTSPMPITILKKNGGNNTAIQFTTSRPAPITESIPGAIRTTARPAVVKPAKPSSSAIFRPPSASVVTKAPTVITTKRTPPRFEILATQKAPAVVAATTRVPTTSTTTTTTTTTTPAPVTTTVKKSKKKPSKKNKKRRRRPSKPENKIGSEVEEKEGKPLTSRIYDYLSGDIIPSFGTTVVGLLMTAGLAGLFLLPIDGFARRSDQFKREEEVDGLVPSIIKAVYTSMNPGEQTPNNAYYEEQGPRRFKRQYRFEGVPYQSSTPNYRRRHPVYPMYKQADTNIMQLEANGQSSFSIVRLIKQMLSVKLDVLSNVLRMASEQLRNYAQHAEIKKPTPVVTADPDESSTDDTTTDLPRDDSTEVILLRAPTTTALPDAATKEQGTVNTPVVEESDEANLIRRRTHD